MRLDLLHITTHSEEIFYRLRWEEFIHCPECGSVHIYNPEAGQLHICADCDHRFSDTSGPAFHSTKLPLAKWLIAIYVLHPVEGYIKLQPRTCDISIPTDRLAYANYLTIEYPTQNYPRNLSYPLTIG